MKIRPLKFLIFLATMVLTLNAIEQQDYVITLKGDTIKCKITHGFSNYRYKPEGTDDDKKIEADEIKEYYIAKYGTRKRSVFIDSSRHPHFMDVVEKGKIDLYEVVSVISGTSGASGSSTSWYVGKGSRYVFDLKNTALFTTKSKRKRKDILGEMLQDDSEVYNKYIAEDKFSFKQILDLVSQYNTHAFLHH